MEVMVQMQNTDFDFKTAQSSPYSTIPSTPTRIGEYYFSAPTSPTSVSTFYRDFDDFLVVNEVVNECGASVPFEWEEKPGKPKHLSQMYNKCEDDFAFDVSQEMERSSVSADEIFDGGKIRPHLLTQENPVLDLERRGRYKVSPHRRTQSVSTPIIKTLDYEFKEEELDRFEKNKNPNMVTESTKSPSQSSCSKGYVKWRLKDFFLFRSASEGRAIEKDPLEKYMPFFKKQEFYKRSSFRAIESPGGSRSRSMRRVSAHELHYTVNRAVSEDLKKKTFLPYKQGILGRLAFNPAVHAIANGFGFSRR